MTGLGKPRTKLGEWLDSKGIKQEWLIKKSGVGKNTITMLCNDEEYEPKLSTMQKVIRALKDIDPKVNGSKFWDI